MGQNRLRGKSDTLRQVADVTGTGSSLVHWARPATIFFSCLFVLLTSVSAYRIYRGHQTPGPFDPELQGYCDFQNGCYFPSLAFARGLSPYGEDYAEQYPVERSIPFFSPTILAFHIPWALLPLTVAEVCYFIWSIGLTLAISFLIVHWLAKAQPERFHQPELRWLLGTSLACFLLVSRGGQQTIFTGYFTLELVLASLVAVHYARTKPNLSGLALLLVSGKPTYILPLGILMAFRGNFRALAIGAGLSIVSLIAGFWWIAPESGFSGLIEEIRVSQETHRLDPYERPVYTWIRVDALAILAKWLQWDPAESAYLSFMLVTLVPAGCLLFWYHRRVNDGGGVPGISGAVVLLLPQIAMYHHVYDCIVLLPICVAALLSRSANWQKISPLARLLIAAGCAFPGLNYLSSQMIFQKLGLVGFSFQLVTSLNCGALILASTIMLVSLVVVAKQETLPA